MHFSTIFTATLFAALASAAPAPSPQVTVNPGQIQQFVDNVQGFANNVGSNFDQLSAEFNALQGGWSGAGAEAARQAFSEFGQSVAEIRNTASRLASALSSSSSSFEEAESSVGSAFS